MPIMQWDQKFSVGLATIDAQHQKLISYLNELYDAMRQGKGKDKLEKTLQALIAYTSEHFQTEEKLMKQFHYPDAESHFTEHASFVQHAIKFQRDFESGKIMLTTEVMKFLNEWVQNHILGTDKKYSLFFIEKGVK